MATQCLYQTTKIAKTKKVILLASTLHVVVLKSNIAFLIFAVL